MIASYKPGDLVASRDGYGDGLVQLGENHPDIVVVDADLAKSTKAIVFAKKFPSHFKYMGICEADMVSMAAGMARCGKVPFVSSFASFLVKRALDQIRVSVAYSQTNVKLTGSHAGIATGQDGPTGQSILDLAIMRAMPNFHVFVPADYYETVACTQAMYDTVGPCYMRTCREKTPIVFDGVPEFRPGQSVLLREGTDASIVACGAMIGEALAAAALLEKEKISVSVLNASSLKPLDSKAIDREAQKSVLVSAEDATVNGGLGSAIAERIAENRWPARLVRVGVQDTFAESGQAHELFEKYGMSAQAIAEKLKNALKQERK
ncbi:MAG: transketolase family protein [Candidatus Diapherotrites archaeon]|nr:transketolase family protein [Candidatus Diapherotrites archaeon]